MDCSLPNTIQKYTDDRIAVLFKRLEDLYKQQENYGRYIEGKLDLIDLRIESLEDCVADIDYQLKDDVDSLAFVKPSPP